MNRRLVRRIFCQVFLALLVTASRIYGADPKIVEGAKKEGKLVAYVSMLTENAASLPREFRKKYPFIETSLYRANTEKLLPKIQLPARTQQHEADVIGSYPANPNVESELRKKTAGYRLHPVNPKMMSRFDEINKQYMETLWKNS